MDDGEASVRGVGWERGERVLLCLWATNVESSSMVDGRVETPSKNKQRSLASDCPPASISNKLQQRRHSYGVTSLLSHTYLTTPPARHASPGKDPTPEGCTYGRRAHTHTHTGIHIHACADDV